MQRISQVKERLPCSHTTHCIAIRAARHFVITGPKATGCQSNRRKPDAETAGTESRLHGGTPACGLTYPMPSCTDTLRNLFRACVAILRRHSCGLRKGDAKFPTKPYELPESCVRRRNSVCDDRKNGLAVKLHIGVHLAYRRHCCRRCPPQTSRI